MLIISTRPVAEIIHAVSAASILAGCAAAWATPGVAAISIATQPSAPLRAITNPVISPPISSFLQRVVVGLAGADAHGAIEVVDKDFPVADLAGLGGVADRGHHLVFDAVLDTDLDLELRQEVHGVFGAPVNFGVALLPAEALHLGHGHAVDAERGERIANFFELERLDDGDNELHGSPLIGPLGRGLDRQRTPAPMVWASSRAYAIGNLLGD